VPNFIRVTANAGAFAAALGMRVSGSASPIIGPLRGVAFNPNGTPFPNPPGFPN
jgi:hypothetical protein